MAALAKNIDLTDLNFINTNVSVWKNIQNKYSARHCLEVAQNCWKIYELF